MENILNRELSDNDDVMKITWFFGRSIPKYNLVPWGAKMRDPGNEVAQDTNPKWPVIVTCLRATAHNATLLGAGAHARNDFAQIELKIYYRLC